MDFSRLNIPRLTVGLTSSALLLISLFFLPWYTVEETPQRVRGDDYNPDAWICGEFDFECTGFDTFPIMRWLLIGAALAPIILAYILVRAHKLSYPPGELTMIAGFTAMVLIGYNGIVDKPGAQVAETGIGLDYGYWIALVASIAIAGVGLTRSLESGAKGPRKPPGTV